MWSVNIWSPVSGRDIIYLYADAAWLIVVIGSCKISHPHAVDHQLYRLPRRVQQSSVMAGVPPDVRQRLQLNLSKTQLIGRVSYIRIYLCYFCFRWKTVSLVQASLQYLMHHVTVSLQQSKISLQNNCINNTSITQPTLSFYFWLKM